MTQFPVVEVILATTPPHSEEASILATVPSRLFDFSILPIASFLGKSPDSPLLPRKPGNPLATVIFSSGIWESLTVAVTPNRFHAPIVVTHVPFPVNWPVQPLAVVSWLDHPSESLSKILEEDALRALLDTRHPFAAVWDKLTLLVYNHRPRARMWSPTLGFADPTLSLLLPASDSLQVENPRTRRSTWLDRSIFEHVHETWSPLLAHPNRLDDPSTPLSEKKILCASVLRWIYPQLGPIL